MVVDEGWRRLPEHWCGAFRQAWAAYVAGTIPVGSVVVGRRRQWQVEKLRGPFAVFAELLLAVYTVEARPTSLTGRW